MDINQRKEQYSIAYVRAIASVAGFTVEVRSVDIDSIDLAIIADSEYLLYVSPSLEVQLKCTARDVLREHDLHFPLPKRNYDGLRRTNQFTPRILVVLVVPEKLNDWTVPSEEHLLLRHCAYWYSLYGQPERPNTATVTVRIPRQQIFDVESLQKLLQSIGEGTPPWK